jgi:hypothetical protein
VAGDGKEKEIRSYTWHNAAQVSTRVEHALMHGGRMEIRLVVERPRSMVEWHVQLCKVVAS